jgi:hypothetical protein
MLLFLFSKTTGLTRTKLGMNDDWFGPLKYTKETRSQEVSNCVLSGFFFIYFFETIGAIGTKLSRTVYLMVL